VLPITIAPFLTNDQALLVKFREFVQFHLLDLLEAVADLTG